MPSKTYTEINLFMPSVVWTQDNFENNFEIKNLIAKYSKESCELISD